MRAAHFRKRAMLVIFWFENGLIWADDGPMRVCGGRESVRFTFVPGVRWF